MNYAILALVVLAFLGIQTLIGGTRLLFSLPAYGVLALVAGLSIWGRRDGTAPRGICLGVVTIFFAWILGRAALSPVPHLWWPDFFMVLACLITYGVFAFYLTGSRARAWWIAILLVLAAAEVLVGIRQFAQGDGWLPYGLIRADYGRRASGFYVSPIHLAGYLEAVAAFALAMTFWSTWPGWVRGLTAYTAAMCYVGVAITGSRGGYLSVIASILVFTGISLWAVRRAAPARFGSRALAALLGLCLLAGVGGTLMSQSEMLRSRMAMLTAQLDRSRLDIRIYNWQAALDQFRVSPIVGTGAGTHLYYGRLFRRPQLQSDPVHAHSDYLELLAEYGLVGGVGMIFFLGVHLWSSVKGAGSWIAQELGGAYSLRHDGLAVQIGCFSAVSALMVHSVMDFNLHIPGTALLFASIFGMMANPGLEGARPLNSFVEGWRWILLPVGVAIAALGLPKLPGEYWCEEARKALRNQDFSRAITFAERGLRTESQNPDIWFYLGEAHRSQAIRSPVRSLRGPALERAVAAYQQGLKVFPQSENHWVRLGQSLDGLARFPEAEVAYRNAMALDPALGILHAYYAAHFQARGREEEAEAQMALARTKTPEDVARIYEGVLRSRE